MFKNYFLIFILFLFNFLTNALLIIKNKQAQTKNFFYTLKQNKTYKINKSNIFFNLKLINNNNNEFINNQINSSVNIYQINNDKNRHLFLIKNNTLNNLNLSNKLKKQFKKLFKYKRELLLSTSSLWKNTNQHQTHNQNSLQNNRNFYIKKRLVEISMLF